LNVESGLPTRFTFTQGVFPLWTRDGRRVVFRSTRSSVYGDFYEKAIDGNGGETLLLETNGGAPLDWSPDGRTLLYMKADKGQPDLWALPTVGGDHTPFQVTHASSSETNGQFSPNGGWVAYQSNQSGRFEIYVQAFPASTGETLVSAGGGIQPRWSHDGTELFYLAPDGQLMSVQIKLMEHSIEARTPVALFRAQLAALGSNYTSDTNLLHQYSVAPDGRFLVTTTMDEATPPITVVLNWDVDLAK
jgi:Tol biopolymer transport system component